MTEKLTLILEADGRQLTKGLKQAEKALESLDDSSEKAAKGIEDAMRDVADSVAKAGQRVRDARDRFVSIGTAIETTGGRLRDARGRFVRAGEAVEKLGNRLAGAADRTSKAGRAFEKLGAQFAAFEARAASAVSSVGRSVLSLRGALAGIAAGAGAAAPVKFASDFETALANVDTLLVGAEVSIGRYKDQLLELSKASSKELIDLTQGLYQVISAGIPAVEGAGGAFDVLVNAQRAAVAGLATTEQAVNAFVTVLNAYEKSGLTAAEVSDKLFTTVRIGRTTFPELASGIGRVATVGAQFGISIDEILASIARLTKAGLSTDEAVTQLRATILSLAKPTEQSKDLLAGLGVEIGENAFRAKGLAGVLADVSNATGDSADLFAQLFPNVRALVGALALGTDAAGGFKRDLEQLNQAVGATDAAYQKIAATFGETAAIFKSQLQAVLVEAGGRVLPRIQKAVESFGEALVKNQDQIAEAFTGFVELLFSVGEFVTENGERIVTFFTTFFSVKLITAATNALVRFAGVIKSTVAIAAAGQAAGGEFLTGFQKGVKSLPALITGLLRSPTLLAGVAAIGILIAQTIVDAFTEGADDAEARAKRRAEASKRQTEAEAKKRGFGSQADREAAVTALESGEKVLLGPNIREGQIVTPEAAVQRAIGAGFDAKQAAEEVLKAADPFFKDSLARAELAEKAARTFRAEIEAVESRLSILVQDRSRLERQRLEDELKEKQAGLAEVEARAQRLRAGVDAAQAAVRAAAEGRTDAEETAKAEEKARESAKARVAAEKQAAAAAEQRRAALTALSEAIEQVRQGEASLRQVQVEALQADVDARRQSIEAAAALERAEIVRTNQLRIAELQAAGAADDEVTAQRKANAEELAAFDKQAAEDVIEAIEAQAAAAEEVSARRQDIAQRQADAAIQQAEQEGAALAALFAEGSEQRIQAELATAARVLQIREQLALDTQAVERDTIAKIAQLQKERQDAAARAQPIQRPESEKAKVEEEEGFLGKALDVAGGALADFGIGAFITPLLGSFGAAFSSLGGGLDAAVAELLSLDVSLEEAAENARSAINQAAEQAAQIVERVAAVLPSLVETFIETFVDVAPVLVGALLAAVPDLLDAILRGVTVLLSRLDETIGPIFSALVQAVSGAILAIGDNIGPIFQAAIRGVFRTVAELLERIPEVLDDLIASLVTVVGDFIGAIPGIIGEIFSNLPKLFSALIKIIPLLVRNILEGVVRGLQGYFESLFGAEFWGQLADTLTDVLAEFFEPLSSAVEALADPIAGLLGLNAPPPGVAGPGVVSAPVDRGARLPANTEAALERAKRARDAAARAGDQNGVAYWQEIIDGLEQSFHRGGMVKGGSNAVLANIMRAAGAPGFANGGIVRAASSRLRSQIAAPFADDVPAVLRQGEGVLTPMGVATAGGEAGLNALNRGQAPAAGGVRVVIEPSGSAALDALMSMMIGAWRVEADTPGSVVRKTLDTERAFPGVQMVRGRT